MINIFIISGIYENSIGDSGARMIGEVLKVNSTLTNLALNIFLLINDVF